MKSFEKDIKKYAEKNRLKASERNELRARVLTYMEYHPLPKQTMHDEIEKIESEQFKTLHFNTFYTRIIAGAFALFLVVGVPVAAEYSMPGDVLYPFKTQINEGVRSQFADSPYEKIALETELMERRISEARLLKREGRLTKALEASLSENVEEHANAAQQSIAELRSNNSEDAEIAEITFGSALEVQSAILDAQANGYATSATSSIAEVVRRVQANIAAHKSSSTPSFEGLMARVELETTRAYELFSSVNDSITSEQKTDIERRLEDISRKIAKAQEFHEDSEPRAVSELVSALALTHKLVAFMTDIDVSSSVSLDTLVPIEFTDEERIAIAKELLGNVEGLQETVQGRSEYIEEEGLQEKVAVGLEEMSTRMRTATSSFATGDIDAAEEALTEAYALATDLMKMTDAIAVPVDIDTDIGTGTPTSSPTTTPTTTDRGTSTVGANVATTSQATTTENQTQNENTQDTE